MKISGKVIIPDPICMTKMAKDSLFLSSFMLASSAFVSIGAFLLRYYSMVPVMLTYLTAAAVLSVLITSFFVHRGSRLAMNIGVILSALAILSSLSSISHLEAMTRIFRGGLITVLDLLEILGFYAFPLLYIFYWAVAARKRGPKSTGLKESRD